MKDAFFGRPFVFISFLGSLVAVLIIVPGVYHILHMKDTSAELSFPVVALLVFTLIREGLIGGLRKLLAYQWNAN